MAPQKRCLAKGCRFSWTHVTSYHRCGACGSLGHGKRECKDPVERRRLFFSASRSPPSMPPEDWCSVPGCDCPDTHSSSAHHCRHCGKRSEGSPCCETGRCPMCNTFGKVLWDLEVFTGSDCAVCFERAPCVVFETCKHANVCKRCATHIFRSHASTGV